MSPFGARISEHSESRMQLLTRGIQSKLLAALLHTDARAWALIRFLCESIRFESNLKFWQEQGFNSAIAWIDQIGSTKASPAQSGAFLSAISFPDAKDQ